jgi:hypothetical protein
VANVDPTLDRHLGHKHKACLPQFDSLSQFDYRSEDDMGTKVANNVGDGYQHYVAWARLSAPRRHAASLTPLPPAPRR